LRIDDVREFRGKY